jgi:hypothetical protein
VVPPGGVRLPAAVEAVGELLLYAFEEVPIDP